ncbi:glycoside hydrolase family 5 protein [Auriculariales sp. MPI-PUGE-AT-0066]|nr:glycoside hydrolase family 5 protein [Auriculariales sp. MPI-PUGE-AT-0066]
MVTGGDGKQFQYVNKVGGNWLFDSANPWNGGKANSWTPAINESWTWGKDRIFGVNLGGWLVLEAFITPSLFERTHSMDEWTMHGFLTKVAPTNPTEMLEEHYSTFITEQDFAQIAGAGLNWVRLPIPYWAIEVWEGEQFIPRIQWKYFLKAIEWARKYGLRINLDLHGVPGSQNGWNHSGRLLRYPNWLKTPMGTANAQRSLSYIRVITQFISQEQYANVVPMFGIVNEPYNIGLADAPVKSFYAEAYKMMRTTTGIGKGPVMSIFAQGTTSDQWTQNFLPGADRVALDAHPYWAFGEASQTTALELATTVCKAHAVNFNTTWNNVGPVSAGEWSLAINDCGKWVGQGNPIKYEVKFGNGSCLPWDDYTTWTADTKAGFQAFWKAQWDALGDAFFWTWKIGPSMVSNKIEAPFWSYQLGLEQGWIGSDPRVSFGYCASLGVPESVTRTTTLKPNQIGQDANAVPSDANTYPWPPTAFFDVPIAANVPQYTPTGTIITMPGPTFTDPANPKQTIDAGTGWFNAQDTEGMYVPVAGCTYPDPWAASGTTPTKCP